MNMERPPKFEEDEIQETFFQKLKRKAINNPFLTTGVVGLIGMCGVGAYKYKSLRSTGMSTSIFLIQLRVAAQSMVVGALTIALLKDTIVELISSEKPEDGKS